MPLWTVAACRGRLRALSANRSEAIRLDAWHRVAYIDQQLASVTTLMRIWERLKRY